MDGTVKVEASTTGPPTVPLTAASSSNANACGVGLVLYIRGGYPVVQQISAGGPAAASGKILKDDMLVQIRDQQTTGGSWVSTKGRSLAEISAFIVGEAGTQVHLCFHRTKNSQDLGPLSSPSVLECNVTLVRFFKRIFNPEPPRLPAPTTAYSGHFLPSESISGFTRPEPLLDRPNIRDMARNWATGRLGRSSDKLLELDQLMGLVTSTYISSDRVLRQHTLARGSFGTVYVCNLDSGNAVEKVLDFSGQFLKMMRALLLELNILVRVVHPNIVTFWGSRASFPDVQNWAEASDSDPDFSMVFELCDRGTLRQAIFDPQKKLTTAQKISIGLQVAYGLRYLHTPRVDDRRSVIHRDLNSSNILLDSNGVAKISDFGCARVVDRSEPYYTTTIMGTCAYMAPEQLQGQDLTHAIDVWAFSVVLWEMMTEQPPWEGPLQYDVEALKNALIQELQVLPISEAHRDSFPAPYIQAIQAGMTLTPWERPSMSEMAELLKEAQQLERGPPSPQGGLEPDEFDS